MPYTIEIALEAEASLAAMKAFQRVELLDVIDQHLTHTPTIISRSRIKRLRLLDSPAYRLRVGDYLSKAASLDYLRGVGGKE